MKVESNLRKMEEPIQDHEFYKSYFILVLVFIIDLNRIITGFWRRSKRTRRSLRSTSCPMAQRWWLEPTAAKCLSTTYAPSASQWPVAPPTRRLSPNSSAAPKTNTRSVLHFILRNLDLHNLPWLRKKSIVTSSYIMFFPIIQQRYKLLELGGKYIISVRLYCYVTFQIVLNLVHDHLNKIVPHIF